MSELHTIKLEWKNFKVHMPDAEKYFRGACGSSYVGNSATVDDLTLWFSEQPSEHVELLVKAYWESLSEEAQAAKMKRLKDLDKAEEVARDNIVNVEFDKMIVAEKKILMGRPLSEEDREALLAKYPAE